MWLYNVQVLFILEDITTKSAIDNFLDLISDRILSEVSSGSSLWTSCHNIDNDMGFHFGLDALEFYYDTIPHGLSWFLFETLVLDRWSVVCYPPPPEVKSAPVQILKVKKMIHIYHQQPQGIHRTYPCSKSHLICRRPINFNLSKSGSLPASWRVFKINIFLTDHDLFSGCRL